MDHEQAVRSLLRDLCGMTETQWTEFRSMHPERIRPPSAFVRQWRHANEKLGWTPENGWPGQREHDERLKRVIRERMGIPVTDEEWEEFRRRHPHVRPYGYQLRAWRRVHDSAPPSVRQT